jgi:hypothetical protein
LLGTTTHAVTGTREILLALFFPLSFVCGAATFFSTKMQEGGMEAAFLFATLI